MPYLFLFFIFLNTITSCNDKNPVTNSSSQSEKNISSTVITNGLSYPWEIVWGPDNFIWMTERGGRISRVDPKDGMVYPLLIIDEVKSRGEGGLLGMALHPDFKNAPYVYVAYNFEQNGNYQEKVVRYTYRDNTLNDPTILLNGISAGGIHNGCRLVISADDKLFISTGENGNRPLSQDLQSLNGKILRINLDGSIPRDNPFKNSPVYSYGHRNAQGLVFVDDKLFSSEHGPNNDDEINIIEKGRNYGWPNVEGFCNTDNEKDFCRKNNVAEPVKAYTPTLAVCGLDYYNSSTISEWKNALLLCTLKESKLLVLKLNDERTSIVSSSEYIHDVFGRLRDVCISPLGDVYVCTSNGRNDVIVKLQKN